MEKLKNYESDDIKEELKWALYIPSMGSNIWYFIRSLRFWHIYTIFHSIFPRFTLFFKDLY